LKPGFFKSEVLGGLLPLTRILFQGLWCLADRAGRLDDRPARIKAEVLPYDTCDIDSMLVDLDAAGLIRRYEVDGRRLIWISGFTRHNSPHYREPESELPEYKEDTVKPRTGSARPRTGSARPGQAQLGSVDPVDPGSVVVVAVGGSGGDNGHEALPGLWQEPPEGTRPDNCPGCDSILNGPDGLNVLRGKRFKPRGEGGRLLHARHKEYGLEACRRVVRTMVAKWKGHQWRDRNGKLVNQEDYLRLTTLFSPGNFNEYLNVQEAESPDVPAATDPEDDLFVYMKWVKAEKSPEEFERRMAKLADGVRERLLERFQGGSDAKSGTRDGSD